MPFVLERVGAWRRHAGFGVWILVFEPNQSRHNCVIRGETSEPGPFNLIKRHQQTILKIQTVHEYCLAEVPIYMLGVSPSQNQNQRTH